MNANVCVSNSIKLAESAHRPSDFGSGDPATNYQIKKILDYLNSHGEKPDTAISEGTSLSLSKTRLHLAALAAKGAVMVDKSIRYEKGKEVVNLSFRAS
jgi:transcription initiation factor IIE alpha subunit